MNVYVVIPNWNGADLLAKCLKSLEKQTHPATIVVVDNGSKDNSIELVEKKFPSVVLLKNSTNLGFAGGVNTGIKYSLEQNANAIALFNNDAVADKNWIKCLVNCLVEYPEAGISTSKLLRSDGKIFDSTGDFYSVWGMPFPRARNQKDKGQFEETEYVFGASGGASLYRASLFETIGLLDERFFAYFEDVDISFRAQLARFTVMYCPEAVAYHEVSATSSKLGSFTRYHSVKNFFILYTKNMPGILYWKYLPLFLLQAIRFAISSTLRGGAWAYLRGFAAFVRLLPSILNDRQKIQKARKVPISYIDDLLYKNRPPRIPSV